MPVTADKPAPYAPPSAILDVIDRYRHRGLPMPVNAEVLGRAGISDSLIPRTLQALQTLDLIDADGRPTGTLEGIRLAPEAEFKKRLEEWLKGAFADVFAFVDPAQDDETRVRDAFRSYPPIGQQARMVTLFQGLCGAAGLARDKALDAKPRQPLRILPKPTKRPQSIQQQKPTKTSNTGSVSHLPKFNSDLPPPLAGLLAGLPSNGRWTKEQRDKFVTTFGAVLDFCFAVVEPGALELEEQSHE
ncbi:DUF5343 domain-containing protein [Bradyrhizobium elkanii]|uniref:DUF5343 domain-containing protein n=1 Tax=Bradyrhizobium elkanii TaxID=29448 RepID=UPI003D1B5668